MRMEDEYEKMRKKGYNSVDNLVHWMKKAKVIEGAQDAEDRAFKLFEDCKDKSNVELEKFKEVLEKIAKEQKKTSEELKNMLAEQAPRFFNALSEAAAAFHKAMKKK